MSRDLCTPPGGADTPAPRRPADARRRDQNEASLTLEPAAGQALATRCLATLTCTYCDVCQLLCPDLCITRDPASGDILIDLDHCKGCGLCAHFCPKGAIRMELEPAR